MKKILIFLSSAILIVNFNCKDKNKEVGESKARLNGNWVLVASCADPATQATSWLMVENNTIRSCAQQPAGYSTSKGTIMETTPGIYRISWENNFIQNAEYPVTAANLFPLENQSGGSDCYKMVSAAQNEPPQGCYQ